MRPADKPKPTERRAAAPPRRGRETALLRIRTAMIEKKLTQAELADAADCHEKTVQNLMHARAVRDQTLFDVCMVLGLDFDETKALWADGPGGEIALPGAAEADASGQSAGAGRPETAPLYMGAYTRAAVDHYIGSYLTVRPAFIVPDLIIAYRTEVSWDDGAGGLAFAERERPDSDYAHTGHIYVPPSSSFVHLVSLTKGAMRTVLAWQLDQGQRMRGLITTVSKSGPTVVPVSAPIVLMKRDAIAASELGEIDRSHACHAGYRSLLDDVVRRGFARLIGT